MSSENAQSDGLRLPGFRRDIEEYDWHHWQEDDFERLTAREITMLRLMNEITEKPEWHRKVFDDAIVSKWHEESRLIDRSKAMFDWCVAESREKAEKFARVGHVEVLDTFAPIVKGDGLVDAETCRKLRVALENLRSSMQDDWHPGSKEQVLDLVHPSLYPLVYGRTRLREEPVTLKETLRSFGDGEVLPRLPPTVSPASFGRWWRREEFSKWSYAFQWLPCEVDLNPRGHREGTVKISSYINNLHPVKQRDIYPFLETLIERSIPLWNACLRPETQKCFKRIACYEAHYDPSGELVLPEPGDYRTSHKPWLSYEEIPPAIQPPVEEQRRYPHKEVPMPPTDLLRDFQAQGLQVIVKIASIELSPDNPRYSGGSWHLEGLQNEHIIATSLFYYSTSNVTPSHLQFRQRAIVDNCDLDYEQGNYGGLETIYGLPPEGFHKDPMIQELGRVETKKGRLLAFPNVLQHRVEPFELVDKSKAGHRSFVALWLVDPHNRIISTRHVPPQRYDWWEEALRERTDIPTRLPPELSEEIFKEGRKGTMSWEEAKAYRLELMEERTRYMHGVDREWMDMTYNFCEH